MFYVDSFKNNFYVMGFSKKVKLLAGTAMSWAGIVSWHDTCHFERDPDQCLSVQSL